MRATRRIERFERWSGLWRVVVVTDFVFALYAHNFSLYTLCCSAVDAATTPHDTIPTWHSLAAESDALQTRPLRSSLCPTRTTHASTVCLCLPLSPSCSSRCAGCLRTHARGTPSSLPDTTRSLDTLSHNPRLAWTHATGLHTTTSSLLLSRAMPLLPAHTPPLVSIPPLSLLSSSRARHSSGLATRTNTRSVSSHSP